MIERFNFYDVYGYFVPGVVCLALLWLPLGIETLSWPDVSLADGVVLIVIAYVVGHFLRALVEPALGVYPLPHDLLLRDDVRDFSDELKADLIKRIEKRFQLNVQDIKEPDDADKKALSRRRQDAFFSCRTTLLQKDASSYAEQFQGMYALMRILTAALLVGTAYNIGWGVSGLDIERRRLVDQVLHFDFGVMNFDVDVNQFIWWVLLSALSVFCFWYLLPRIFRKVCGAIENRKRKWEKRWLWLVLIAVFVVGVLIGRSEPGGRLGRQWFFGISAVLLFAACICFNAFVYFGRTYAAAIYRDFYVLDRSSHN